MGKGIRIVLVGLIGCALVGGTWPAGAQPKPAGPPLSIVQAWPYAGDILLREIARQSVFLAEREGLHLPTRDANLREGGGDGVGVIQPRVTVFPPDVGLTVSLIRGGEEKALWSAALVRGEEPADYRTAVERGEALSRGELLAALRKAGLKDAAVVVGGEGPAAPDEIEAKLGEMNFCSQFAAVRAAHDALRARPDAPRWLGVLARGYANLGQLTAYFWNTAPQVFEARSLLYAQKWVAAQPASGEARRHRAYAFAMAGFQAMALDDLDAADKLAPDGGKPAAWMELIRPYCRYESAKLIQAALAVEKPAAQLPLFLCFLTIEHSRNIGVINTYGELAIDGSPENLRVVDLMILKSGVVPNHRLTSLNLAVLSSSIPARIAQMAGVPQPVRAVVGRKGKELDPAAVAAVAQALADAAVDGKDSGEPSWGVLGGLLQEAAFMAIERRAYFEVKQLAVDVGPFIQDAEPLFASHPQAAFIRSYALPLAAGAARQALLSALSFPDAQIKSVRLWRTLAQAGIYAGGNNANGPDADWSTLVMANSDGNSIDAQYELDAGNPSIQEHAAAKLRKICPAHPALVAEEIEKNWGKIAPRLAELEPGWGDHPTILAALAQRHIELGDTDKARQYLERYLEQTPDYWAFEALAKIYLDHNDEAGWLKTLRRAIEAPDYGLSRASYCAEIANHYMDKKDFAGAKPYADAAAGSYSSFGLLTAARCEEGLGHWAEAEQWVRRDAERYDRPFEWMEWCTRTGHGDRAAASAMANAAMKPADGIELDRGARAERGSFLLLSGNVKEASAMLRGMLDASGNPWAGLQLMLLLEAQHDAAGRDAAIKAVIERGPAFRSSNGAARPELVKFATLVRDYFAAGPDAALDVGAVDKLTDGLQPLDAANINYMTGKLLDLRGKKKEADRYYSLAATGPGESTSRMLAGQELRARKGATTAPDKR